jgi:hypothetical protein
MQGDYPHFKTTYVQEELVEYFLLNPTEHALVDTCYGDVHRHGVALLGVGKELCNILVLQRDFT